MATVIDWRNKGSVLAAVRRWPDVFAEEYERGLAAIGEVLRGEIVQLTPTGGGYGAWGHLANSIQASDPAAMPTGWRVTVGTPAAYGAVIEYGRQPGGTMPPVKAIALWIKYTNHFSVVPRVFKRGKRQGETQTEEEALMEIAWPIAIRIAQRGTEGAKMFEKGIQAARDNGSIRNLSRAMKRRITKRCNALNEGAAS